MNVGMNGMWVGMAAANVLAGIAARYWFSRGKWKEITFTYGNNAATRGDVDADSLELGEIDTSNQKPVTTKHHRRGEDHLSRFRPPIP